MSERGPTGDHGQDGSTGATGATGETGADGPSVLTRAQTLALFLFIVTVFVLLAYRSEVNADNIKKNNNEQLEEQQYRQCEERNENIDRSNDLYEGLIWIERKNPFATQSKEALATIQNRIQLYEQNMLVPSDCGGKP